MTPRPYIVCAMITLVVACLFVAPTERADGADTLRVARSAICGNVVDREPVDVGTSFGPFVGKLFCFTQITGAKSPTEVHHLWYFADTERAGITLPVGASSWRTYSSKIIQSHEIGNWRVEILGPEGKLLHTLRFEIAP